MIKQDTSENLVNIVYLGIGSNLGNKKRNIEKKNISKIFKNLLNRLSGIIKEAIKIK